MEVKILEVKEGIQKMLWSHRSHVNFRELR
jgi:hypothetical protein